MIPRKRRLKPPTQPQRWAAAAAGLAVALILHSALVAGAPADPTTRSEPNVAAAETSTVAQILGELLRQAIKSTGDTAPTAANGNENFEFSLSNLTLNDNNNQPQHLMPAAALLQAANLSLAISEEDELKLLNFPSKREDLSTAIPLTVIFALLLVTGCIGNMCTAIVIARPKNKYMHTATNYYLFSLAMSDFLFLTLGLPQEMYTLWQRYPYAFGESFCVIRGYLSEASTYASILTISAFTIERYVAICHPLWAHTMSQLPRAVTSIVIIWILAAVCAIPPAAELGIVTQRGPLTNRTLEQSAQCATKRTIYENMFVVSAIVFFIVPMILVTVLYILIALELRRSSRMNSNLNSSSSNSNNNRKLTGHSSSSTKSCQLSCRHHSNSKCKPTNHRRISNQNNKQHDHCQRDELRKSLLLMKTSDSQQILNSNSAKHLADAGADQFAVDESLVRPKSAMGPPLQPTNHSLAGSLARLNLPTLFNSAQSKLWSSFSNSTNQLNSALNKFHFHGQPTVATCCAAGDSCCPCCCCQCRCGPPELAEHHLARSATESCADLLAKTAAAAAVNQDRSIVEAKAGRPHHEPLSRQHSPLSYHESLIQRAPSNSHLHQSPPTTNGGGQPGEPPSTAGCQHLQPHQHQMSLPHSRSGTLKSQQLFTHNINNCYRQHQLRPTASSQQLLAGNNFNHHHHHHRHHLHHHHHHQQQQLHSRRSAAASSKKSVIRMLVAVVVSFFICWVPFHAQRLLASYLAKDENQNQLLLDIYLKITYSSGVMYYLSSTINPLLYQLMSAKFRLAFKETFRCSLFRCFAWCRRGDKLKKQLHKHQQLAYPMSSHHHHQCQLNSSSNNKRKLNGIQQTQQHSRQSPTNSIKLTADSDQQQQQPRSSSAFGEQQQRHSNCCCQCHRTVAGQQQQHQPPSRPSSCVIVDLPSSNTTNNNNNQLDCSRDNEFSGSRRPKAPPQNPLNVVVVKCNSLVGGLIRRMINGKQQQREDVRMQTNGDYYRSSASEGYDKIGESNNNNNQTSNSGQRQCQPGATPTCAPNGHDHDHQHLTSEQFAHVAASTPLLCVDHSPPGGPADLATGQSQQPHSPPINDNLEQLNRPQPVKHFMTNTMLKFIKCPAKQQQPAADPVNAESENFIQMIDADPTEHQPGEAERRAALADQMAKLIRPTAELELEHNSPRMIIGHHEPHQHQQQKQLTVSSSGNSSQSSSPDQLLISSASSCSSNSKKINGNTGGQSSGERATGEIDPGAPRGTESSSGPATIEHQQPLSQREQQTADDRLLLSSSQINNLFLVNGGGGGHENSTPKQAKAAQPPARERRKSTSAALSSRFHHLLDEQHHRNLRPKRNNTDSCHLPPDHHHHQRQRQGDGNNRISRCSLSCSERQLDKRLSLSTTTTSAMEDCGSFTTSNSLQLTPGSTHQQSATNSARHSIDLVRL